MVHLVGAEVVQMCRGAEVVQRCGCRGAESISAECRVQSAKCRVQSAEYRRGADVQRCRAGGAEEGAEVQMWCRYGADMWCRYVAGLVQKWCSGEVMVLRWCIGAEV